jgi:N-acetylglutamate synthase-like GNAT family acetyltransferase
MPLTWIFENPPHWDESKAAIVGPGEGTIFHLGALAPGDMLPGEWWRVEDEGRTVGYGWMDTSWGDAEVLLAVDESARGRGVGGFILDQLEAAARARGLRYLYNVVPQKHPDPEALTRWLESRGFTRASDDQTLLRRKVPAARG